MGGSAIEQEIRFCSVDCSGPHDRARPQERRSLASEVRIVAAKREAMEVERADLRAVAAPAAARDDLREWEILRLEASGLSDAQIAPALAPSPHFVHRDIVDDRAKRRRPTRAAAAAEATPAGII